MHCPDALSQGDALGSVSDELACVICERRFKCPTRSTLQIRCRRTALRARRSLRARARAVGREAQGKRHQACGTNALTIYPTARTNVDCIFAGKLMWRGWTLVDYRNAGETELGVRVIIDPDSWWGLRSKADVRILRGPQYGWLIRDMD